MRRAEAAELGWTDIEERDDGTGRLAIRNQHHRPADPGRRDCCQAGRRLQRPLLQSRHGH